MLSQFIEDYKCDKILIEKKLENISGEQKKINDNLNELKNKSYRAPNKYFSSEQIIEGETFGINLNVDFVSLLDIFLEIDNKLIFLKKTLIFKLVVHWKTQKSTDLLQVRFNSKSINAYGLRLMDILFTDEERENRRVEPLRPNILPLDPVRVNLIKGKFKFSIIIYLHKILYNSKFKLFFSWIHKEAQ